MVYRDQIEASIEKRLNAGMTALQLLADGAIQGDMDDVEIAKYVGKIGAALGGLAGLCEGTLDTTYPVRPDLNLPLTVPEILPLGSIMKAVCDVYRVSMTDVMGSSRKQNYVRPRHVFFHLARKQNRVSLKGIGEFCGGRDHSTVVQGADSIAAALEIEADLPTIIATVEAALLAMTKNNEEVIIEQGD